MALSATSLANRIKTKYQTRTGESLTDTSLLEEFCQAVIEEIQANAEVLPTSLIAPPGTAGGPVTGTGKVS